MKEPKTFAMGWELYTIEKLLPSKQKIVGMFGTTVSPDLWHAFAKAQSENLRKNPQLFELMIENGRVKHAKILMSCSKKKQRKEIT